MDMLRLFGTVIFLMLTLPAKSQSSAGVKTDMNLSGFVTSRSANINNSMKAGGSAGIFYKYAFLENVVIQADMMFRYRCSEIKNQTAGETANYRYLGIELPLYALLQADIDDRKFFIGMGPFASFGMYNHYKSDARHIDLYKKDPTDDMAILRRWDFGAASIIGYEWECNFQINVNFQIGFRNRFEAGSENIEMLSFLFSLGAGYRF